MRRSGNKENMEEDFNALSEIEEKREENKRRRMNRAYENEENGDYYLSFGDKQF